MHHCLMGMDDPAPTPVVRKSLMAKTWYPSNFSGLYVNGKYALLQTYRHS